MPNEKICEICKRPCEGEVNYLQLDDEGFSDDYPICEGCLSSLEEPNE